VRLSEDRVNSIAGKLARRLVQKGMLVSSNNLRQLTVWIERPILEDLAREDEIDEEVRSYIAGLSKAPPEGSYDWQALFQKKKEEISRRRSFKI
jgi:hypothetical protein